MNLGRVRGVYLNHGRRGQGGMELTSIFANLLHQLDIAIM